MSDPSPVYTDTYFTVVITLRNGNVLKLPCQAQFDDIYENVDKLKYIAFGNTIIRTDEIVTIDHLDPMKVFVSKV